MDDTLQNLIELQEIDTELVKLEGEANAAPGYLTVRERQHEKCRKALEKVEAEIREKELEIKRNELEVGSKEGQKSKLEVQLNSVKTNREYTTLREQISGVEADMSVLEDKLLALMDELDGMQDGLRDARGRAEDARKELEEGKKAAAEDTGRVNKKIEELRDLRSRKVEEIPKEAVRTYEKVLGIREHQGLAPVIDQTCRGCFMTITTHDLTLVTKGDALVQCRFCNRILYIPQESAH